MIRHQNGYLVNVVVPQVFILGPYFFLIYFNYLSGDLLSTVKLFADSRCLFSSANEINNDSNYGKEFQ